MLQLIDRRNAMSLRKPHAGTGLALCLLCFGCGGGGETPTTPSTLAISGGPQVSDLQEYSATITWTTNMEADSRVDYGSTVSYGSTQTEKDLVTSHSIALTGLSAERSYHFKVTSSNGASEVSSTDYGFTTRKDYAILLANGWTAFEGANYDSAESCFSQALAKNPAGAQATHGLAWTEALNGMLTTAAATFQSAIDLGVTTADPLAGLAAVYRDIPDFELAIGYAQDALDLDPDFQFAHNSSFDYKDLHLILAQCYYAEAEYASAQTEVDILNPLNTLNPDNPTYVRNLLLEIESLGVSYGGW
jgi:hypothetical protein